MLKRSPIVTNATKSIESHNMNFPGLVMKIGKVLMTNNATATALIVIAGQ